MSTTTRTTGDGSSEPTVPLSTAASHETIVTAASGDRCTVCGSEMAPDQRYCVECGHRRGSARFSAAGATAGRETVTTTTSVRRGPRAAMSAGTTLIAGIATLLLAIGVGYLIGHGGNQSPNQKGYTIINNGAGVGASGGTASGATGASGLGGSGSSSSSKSSGAPKHALSSKASAKAIKKAPSAATAQKASQAAASTLKAASGVKIAPASTKQGGSCTAGTAGCQNGKFTGNFFGN